jgi:hypothetical protein
LSLVLAALIVAAAIAVASLRIAAEIRAGREAAARGRALTILQAFAPGLEAARADPRALLVWYPLAAAVRRLFPSECAILDGAAGHVFPFPFEQVQDAHARWTTDWLAWERAHDAEYKDRAAVAERALRESNGAPEARARLDAIEREKLDRYQRRYQEYVQTAKALQALIDHAPRAGTAPVRQRPGN